VAHIVTNVIFYKLIYTSDVVKFTTGIHRILYVTNSDQREGNAKGRMW